MSASKWWWWWLPDFHKRWRVEKRRGEALTQIRIDRDLIEAMAQRQRQTSETLDKSLMDDALKRLSDIENAARDATETNQLDHLVQMGKRQGQLRAYLCPI